MHKEKWDLHANKAGKAGAKASVWDYHCIRTTVLAMYFIIAHP